MSGRFHARASPSAPSPPKSLSPKRRPLHQRSDSEINERRSVSRTRNRLSAHQVSRNGQENGPAATAPFVLPKIYTTSPFPAFESQILRPFHDAAAQRPALAGSVAAAQTTAPRAPTQSPTPARHATTTTSSTTPVIIDRRPAPSPSHASSVLHHHDTNSSVRSSASSFQFPDFSLEEAGLVTPSETIRFVDATPSPEHRSNAMTNFSRPHTAQSRHSALHSEDYSPSISDLPVLIRDPQLQSTITPTPATRQYRPTIRPIANLQSDAAQTPGSAKSNNTTGTQVHRRNRAADDLPPRGSYLHFADRRVRRSTSDPELINSSPNVERLYDSVSPSPVVRRPFDPESSPNVRTFAYSPESPPRRDPPALGNRSSRNFSSPVSQRADPENFPALARYVQAASIDSPSPDAESTSRAEMLRSPRRQFRPVRNQWNSVDTTSDLRSMSASPSEFGSEMAALLEEPSTIESALSVSIASHHPSIRVVESSGPSPSRAEFSSSPTQSTPRAINRRFREDTEVPEATTNSPVWVSYSSPVTHMPYVSGSQESLPTPEVARHGLGNISESTSPTMSEGTPASPNAREIIFPVNSSHDVRVPGMRRRSTMRQSTPFFTPGSERGRLRQSTIGQSPSHTPEQSYVFEFGTPDGEPTQATTSAFQPSPDPSIISSLPPSATSTPAMKNGLGWGAAAAPSLPPPRSPLRPRIPFPAGSSVGNTPASIHIPRNRNTVRFSGLPLQMGHSRNQTYGGLPSPSAPSSRSSGSRRSSSPTVPSIDYLDECEPGSSYPYTPPSHPARPSNPTPGVTPATTVGIKSPAGLSTRSPADQPHPYHPVRLSDEYGENRDTSPGSLPSIPPLRPLTRPKTMSFLISSDPSTHTGTGPSNAGERMHTVTLKHKPGRRDLLDQKVNNDWAPHLWHGPSSTLNRRSVFLAPSVSSVSSPFLRGSKARRDLQVLLFVLGFLLPPCWLVASLLPLPGFGRVVGLGGLGGGRSERLVKGKSVIGIDDLEKEIQWTADEVAGYESARWWRRVNRGLSAVGLGICAVLIVVGVITSRGGIQVPEVAG